MLVVVMVVGGVPHQSMGCNQLWLHTHQVKTVLQLIPSVSPRPNKRSFSGAGLFCCRSLVGFKTPPPKCHVPATSSNSGATRRRARSSGLVLGASERIPALGVLLCRYCASVTGEGGLKRCSCHRNGLIIAVGAGVLARIVPPPNGPYWERGPGPLRPPRLNDSQLPQ